MSQPSDDAWLDQQLRETPLPDGLQERLRACLYLSDDKMDARLREVHIPSVVLARLHDVPADCGIDAAVAVMDVPEYLETGLRQVAQVECRQRRLAAARRFIEAAALTAALSLGFVALATSWISGTYQEQGGSRAHEIVVAQAPWELLASQSAEHSVSIEIPRELNNFDRLGLSTSVADTLTIALPEEEPLPRSGPVSRWLAARDAGLNPALNVVFLRWGVLASNQRMEDDLPVIERTDLPRPAGLEPPISAGYNRAFWLKHHVQPPMPPHVEKLRTAIVPVVTSTRSFDRAERLASGGTWPGAADVRPEEFLAATVRYPLPRLGQVALHVAGGPSRFGSNGVRLLQVGVQAGLPLRKEAPSTHLIVLLDASASMGRSGRWSGARQALARLPLVMGTADRVSLIPFAENEVVNLDGLRSTEIFSALGELSRIRPTGSFDLAAAVEHAAALALGDGNRTASQRIVIVTDDDSPLPQAIAERVQSLLQTIKSAGIFLDVADTVGGSGPQPHLADLADWAGGRAAATRDAGEIYWSLVASLLGQSPTVASEVTMQVEFNPRKVIAYRLIGHEANALSTFAPGHAPADLRAGEAATSLFELWLADNTETEIATTKVTWKDANGQRLTSEQRCSSLQLAGSLADCPPAFQAAAVAAETAELLRGSRDALREIGASPGTRTGIDNLLEAARKIPAVPEMVEERVRLNRLLEELRRRAGQSRKD